MEAKARFIFWSLFAALLEIVEIGKTSEIFWFSVDGKSEH